MTGIGKIDATVTGNRRELQAAGNVVGDGLKYGDNGALTISSDFTANVPDLTVADASVTANTHATFVTVGGQNINEVDAKTTYARSSSTSTRPPSSRSGRSARPARCCCIPIIRKSTCSARPGDAGPELAAGAGIARRRSTTRRTPSPCRI